jgi:hypothetical protein
MAQWFVTYEAIDSFNANFPVTSAVRALAFVWPPPPK